MSMNLIHNGFKGDNGVKFYGGGYNVVVEGGRSWHSLLTIETINHSWMALPTSTPADPS